MADEAVVVIDGGSFAVGTEAPLVFGRSDAPGVVGLDASDMGKAFKEGGTQRAHGAGSPGLGAAPIQRFGPRG